MGLRSGHRRRGLHPRRVGVIWNKNEIRERGQDLLLPGPGVPLCSFLQGKVHKFCKSLLFIGGWGPSMDGPPRQGCAVLLPRSPHRFWGKGDESGRSGTRNAPPASFPPAPSVPIPRTFLGDSNSHRCLHRLPPSGGIPCENRAP